MSDSSVAKKGALRKAGFYLAGIIHARYQESLEKLIKTAAAESPAAKIAQSLVLELRTRVDSGFSQAVSIFEKELKAFVEENGKDEDAALKNSDFAKRVFEAAKSAPPETELDLRLN